MEIAVDVALVLLGLLAVGLTALRVWRRIRRVGRQASLTGKRAAALGDELAKVSARIDIAGDSGRPGTPAGAGA